MDGTGGISGLFITKTSESGPAGSCGIWTERSWADCPARNAGGHGVAVTDSGDVYIAQLSGVVQKFVKQ